MAAMFEWLSSEPLRFASDATLTAVVAAGFAVIAFLATLAERRRDKRKRLDKVGLIPWTNIAVAAFFAAMALGMLAIKSWLAP